MNNFAFYRRNALRGAALASVAALGMGASASALAATAPSSSDATIVGAIGITNTTALGFGSAIADAATAGTVVMGTGGARTCTTVTCVAQDAGQASAFDVNGEAGYTYAIKLPASTTLSDTATTPNTMTVDTFTDSKAGTGTLSASGADSFTVGATLHVGAGQVADTYTGTFDVTVEYN